MKLNFKKMLLPALACSLIVPLNSFATNGYFLIGFGSKSRAMGGVGVAHNMDGLAAAFNPATMIDSDDSFDLAGELFIPRMAVQHESGLMGVADETSNHDKFMIPALGGIYKWDSKITLGVAMVGAGLKPNITKPATTVHVQRRQILVLLARPLFSISLII